MYERLIQKLINRNVGAIAGTLTPTGGTTYCTVEYGGFVKTYNGSTMDGADFKIDQTCLSEWYWTNPVNVTKFSMFSKYYYPSSRINGIWGRVNGSWVKIWDGDWRPAHLTWDSKAISCNNCTGIRISQTHSMQNWRAGIMEVTVEYTVPPPPEGDATIVSIEKPSTFTPGVQFRIRPTFRNDGGDDTLFATLTNTGTGAVLYDNEVFVLSGKNWVPSMYVTLTQKTDFHGRIRAGHIE